MNFKTFLYIGVPVLAFGGLLTWRFSQKNAEAAALAKVQEQRKKAPANTVLATLERRDIVRTLETVGQVEAQLNVKLSPKVAGRIDFLQLREGAPVKMGQVLVRLDPAEVEGQVLQQEAALAEARSRLAQAQLGMLPTDVSIGTQINQQKASVSSSSADFEQTSQNFVSQVAAADAVVDDNRAKVSAAEANLNSAKADLESAQANLTNSKTKYDRIYSLYKDGYIAAQDVDDAKTQVAVSEGALKVAQSKVAAANSALDSAKSGLKSAQYQASIVRTKGKSDITAAKARLKQANASLDSANANRANLPAYRANIAALQATVRAAEGQLRQAQARRADTQLSSPADGVVTGRYMDPGMIATPGQPILQVSSVNSVFVTTNVPIEESQNVRQGQTVSIQFDALPGRNFSGVVTEINPAADVQSRQFLVRVTLPNKDGALRAGMYARVVFTMESVKNVVVVPREAVSGSGTEKVVRVVQADGTAKETPVVLGASDANGFEVKGDSLKAGDKVVVVSYQKLRDGQKVNVGKKGKAQ